MFHNNFHVHDPVNDSKQSSLKPFQCLDLLKYLLSDTIDDCAKDGGKELFTGMHRVL